MAAETAKENAQKSLVSAVMGVVRTDAATDDTTARIARIVKHAQDEHAAEVKKQEAAQEAATDASTALSNAQTAAVNAGTRFSAAQTAYNALAPDAVNDLYQETEDNEDRLDELLTEETTPVTDENGDPVMDEDGNPVTETNEVGRIVNIENSIEALSGDDGTGGQVASNTNAIAAKKAYIDNIGEELGLNAETGEGTGEGGMMLHGMVGGEATDRMGADTMLGGRIDSNAASISSNADMIAANMNAIGSNAASIADNRTMIGELSDDLDVVRAGVAASMALAGMPSINGRGISIGVGSFDGESAFAVGFQIQGEMASFKVGLPQLESNNRQVLVSLDEAEFRLDYEVQVTVEPTQGWVGFVHTVGSFIDTTEQPGAVPTRVVELEGPEAGISSLSLSPDGERIVFATSGLSSDVSDLPILVERGLGEVALQNANLRAVRVTGGGIQISNRGLRWAVWRIAAPSV